VPSDPGAPIVPPTTGAETVDEGPAADSSTATPSAGDAPTGEATDAPAATSETPASDDADEPEAADEGGEDDDEADGGEADERGEDEGDAAPELSEEEQLEARIEAARNLLRSAPTPRSTFIQATLKDFRSDSQLWFELEEPDLDSALIGDRLFLRLPLPPRPAEGPEVGFVIAARVSSLEGKESDFSNLVSLLPEAPPPAPQEVTVEAQSDGIHVDWTAELDPKDGFRVYRREAQTRTYGEPVGTVLAALRSYVDRQAIYGARYIYTVTSVAKLSPLLESEVSSEHEIDYQDRFGPAIPGGLVAFPEAGRVRLLWTPVADPDLAGYEVLRRAATEAEPRVVTAELVTGGQYLDQGVPSGEWFYVVRAVDTTGNRGAESTEAPARVP
jgi:hypothetical protein